MAERRRMYALCDSNSDYGSMEGPQEKAPTDAALQNCTLLLAKLKAAPQVMKICVFVSQMNIES